VFVVSGIIASIVGFSIFRFLAYIKDEDVDRARTRRPESAIPSMMEKSNGFLLAAPSRSSLVCRPAISFNLDGTQNIYDVTTLFTGRRSQFDLSSAE